MLWTASASSGYALEEQQQLKMIGDRCRCRALVCWPCFGFSLAAVVFDHSRYCQFPRPSRNLQRTTSCGIILFDAHGSQPAVIRPFAEVPSPARTVSTETYDRDAS